MRTALKAVRLDAGRRPCSAVQVIDSAVGGGAARADLGVDPLGHAMAIWQQFEGGRPDDGSRSNIAINRFDGATGAWASAVLAESGTRQRDQSARKRQRRPGAARLDPGRGRRQPRQGAAATTDQHARSIAAPRRSSRVRDGGSRYSTIATRSMVLGAVALPGGPRPSVAVQRDRVIGYLLQLTWPCRADLGNWELARAVYEHRVQRHCGRFVVGTNRHDALCAMNSDTACHPCARTGRRRWSSSCRCRSRW